MNIMTTRAGMMLRSVARRLHISQAMLDGITGRKQEEIFSKAVLSHVKSGDTVWDIGAFYGDYTKPLSDAVGPTGRVFAFEPNPETRTGLQRMTADRENVTIVPVALGESSGSVRFLQRGGRSRVLENAEDPDVVNVRMETGDRVVELGEADQPLLMKIDTEGLEFAVLSGLGNTLSSPHLRGVFIEVHFQLLAERYPGRNVPAEIVALLKSYGFRTSWADPSHLVALRQAA